MIAHDPAGAGLVADTVVVNSYISDMAPASVQDSPVTRSPVAVEESAVGVDSVMQDLPGLGDWWATGEDSPEFSAEFDVDELRADVTPTTVAGAALLGLALASVKRRKRDSETE